MEVLQNNSRREVLEDRLNFKVSKRLHKLIKEEAFIQEKSIGQLCRELLEKGLQ